MPFSIDGDMTDPISYANDSKKLANAIMKKIDTNSTVPLLGLFTGPSGIKKGSQILYDYKDKPSNLFWRSKVSRF